ncbi:hypothetical protein OAG24_00370 [bacterium]|nr:hypothetical protein [bacterium]
MSNQKKSPPSFYIPGYPPLNSQDDVGKAAVEGQFIAYPKISRSQVDIPIPNQEWVNISVMPLDEPKKLKNGKNFYGFLQVRGSWPNQEIAKIKASEIISQIDSKNKIVCVPGGRWVPFSSDEQFISDTTDVSDDPNDHKQLRTQAVKDKQKEDEKHLREIREREEELKESEKKDEDPNSLDSYITHRVTEKTIREVLKRRKKEIKKTEDQLMETCKILKTLERDFPKYSKDWIARYNSVRKERGIPEYIPGEHESDEYESLTLEYLENLEEEKESELEPEQKKIYEVDYDHKDLAKPVDETETKEESSKPVDKTETKQESSKPVDETETKEDSSKPDKQTESEQESSKPVDKTETKEDSSKPAKQATFIPDLDILSEFS